MALDFSVGVVGTLDLLSIDVERAFLSLSWVLSKLGA